MADSDNLTTSDLALLIGKIDALTAITAQALAEISLMYDSPGEFIMTVTENYQIGNDATSPKDELAKKRMISASDTLVKIQKNALLIVSNQS